jgi:hypothetical protein
MQPAMVPDPPVPAVFPAQFGTTLYDPTAKVSASSATVFSSAKYLDRSHPVRFPANGMSCRAKKVQERIRIDFDSGSQRNHASVLLHSIRRFATLGGSHYKKHICGENTFDTPKKSTCNWHLLHHRQIFAA